MGFNRITGYVLKVAQDWDVRLQRLPREMAEALSRIRPGGRRARRVAPHPLLWTVRIFFISIFIPWSASGAFIRVRSTCYVRNENA